MIYSHTRGEYESPETRVRLLDFGTSYFTDVGFSRQRHWQIVQTFEKIIDCFDDYLEVLTLGWAHDYVNRPDEFKLAFYWDVLDALQWEAGVSLLNL